MRFKGEKESVCVCVCEGERERDREWTVRETQDRYRDRHTEL